MKFALFLLMSLSIVWAERVRIATYNVENLFDLHYDHSEYVEYIPNTSWQWNQKNYTAKLNNIARVIKDVDAQIVALQEIESLRALKDLRAILKQNGTYYPYYAIADGKNTTVKVALLSHYPLRYTKELWVQSSRRFRNILEAKLDVDGHPLILFVNHWKSKSGPESRRIISAKVLKKRLTQLPYDTPIVILGDFNSDYEEYKTFKKLRRHNDTHGVTGINHILKTYDDEAPVSQESLLTCKGCLYNLWYDVSESERWSHVFKNNKEALDNILISKSMLTGPLQYIPKSMQHFKAPYLLKKSKPYRWQQSHRYPKHHIAKGYSDHLPVYADFMTP